MGYHTPVLLQESIDGLNIKSGGVYVDVTFGGGGHSAEILKRLGQGRLYAIDQDSDAAANVPNDKRITFIHGNFRYLSNYLNYYNEKFIDGLIADLGVSSHHFDDASRGFSFQFDTALDMRMNRTAGLTARDVINKYSTEELTSIFSRYGEVENSKRLASTIVEVRKRGGIDSVQQFKDAIIRLIPRNAEHKYLAKVFQALRIEVNGELESLEELLTQSLQWLRPGGRLSFITYHSLEDRLVKQFLKTGNTRGEADKDFYGQVHTPFLLINKKPIEPGETEIEQNNRARSAKLRIAGRK
jgi:16S rRNA (cytosine1402-N4)-methyltransferase